MSIHDVWAANEVYLSSLVTHGFREYLASLSYMTDNSLFIYTSQCQCGIYTLKQWDMSLDSHCLGYWWANSQIPQCTYATWSILLPGIHVSASHLDSTGTCHWNELQWLDLKIGHLEGRHTILLYKYRYWHAKADPVLGITDPVLENIFLACPK